jgi:hypothetical protein
MNDPIYTSFLERQHAAAMELSRASDRVTIAPIHGRPPFGFLVAFDCHGLICEPDGTIAPAEHFAVGIQFPPDYLKRANPAQVLTFLGPESVWNPNIDGRIHQICLGRLIQPGTELIDIVTGVYELLIYKSINMNEAAAFPGTKQVCIWARNHANEFPLDTRPLRRESLELDISLTE